MKISGVSQLLTSTSGILRNYLFYITTTTTTTNRLGVLLLLFIFYFYFIFYLFFYGCYVISCHRPFIPGTALESAVFPTAQASGFRLQYFPHNV
jgi:hypothetical protein